MSVSDKPLPQGMQLTSLDADFREDPYAILRQVQQQTRFQEDRELGRYFFTHHDDVKQILRDKDYWSDPRKARAGTFSREVLGASIPEGGEPSMLLMDEPGHRRPGGQAKSGAVFRGGNPQTFQEPRR
jgi:cytochrome P450